MMRYIALLLTCVLVLSCDPQKDSLIVINHGTQTLLVNGTNCYAKNKCAFNSDSIVDGRENPYYIKPGDSLTIGSYGWSNCDTISLMFYQKKMIDEKGWETVCEKSLYDSIIIIPKEFLNGKIIDYF